MTAQIVGFHSRSDLNMRLPRSVSYNITPSQGGCTKHYGGSSAPPSDHADCIARWLSWQNYHMDGNGWADIAYTAGYCNHGYVLAGRGYGVRTAANGTDAGNDDWYAFTWIGGGTHTPTRQALDALDWLVYDARRNGDAGNGVNSHRDHKSTECPGDYLDAYTVNPVPPPDVPQTTEEDEMLITKYPNTTAIFLVTSDGGKIHLHTSAEYHDLLAKGVKEVVLTRETIDQMPWTACHKIL